VEPYWLYFGPQTLHPVGNPEYGKGKLLSLSKQTPETTSVGNATLL